MGNFLLSGGLITVAVLLLAADIVHGKEDTTNHAKDVSLETRFLMLSQQYNNMQRDFNQKYDMLNAQIRNEKKDMEREILKLKSEVSLLTQENTPLKNQNAQMDNVIAFAAHRNSKDGVPSGSTVVFQNVMLNEGGAYNSGSGKFTAPTRGLYYFHMQCRADTQDENCEFGMFANGSRKLSSVANKERGYESTGWGSTEMVLNAGDVVEVQCVYDTCVTNQDTHTQFNGALLNQMV